MNTTIFNDQTLAELAARVGQQLAARGQKLVTAESCTGGWIGKVMTDIAGSSAWYLGGAVVYSNQLKQELLGVPAETLARHGAVSEATVRAMAEGALSRIGGDVAVAISGIAGPDGGTPTKPVGTVWFAWSVKGSTPATQTETKIFAGDREAVRRGAVHYALERVLLL